MDFESEKLLIIEPFYGGSHKKLIDAICSNLPVTAYKLITMTAKKWHWRARTCALYISTQIPHPHSFKTLFCTSVLPLAELLGLRPDLGSLHKVVYFHENQLEFPVRVVKERDFQYGFNEIMTCIAADQVLFNSCYNRESFLSQINNHLKLQPDYQVHGLDLTIRAKSVVIYYPLDLITIDKYLLSTKKNNSKILHIVWPHRWEFDKNPDVFYRVICKLDDNGYDFKVSLLGESFHEKPEIFCELLRRFSSSRLLHCGYVENTKEYYRVLRNADVVVSTAIHEFFGVAVGPQQTNESGPSQASSSQAGPPPSTMSDELKKIKKVRAQDKKNTARLSDEQRARLKELRDKKEVGQFLMPDAPPSKKARKTSPTRTPCPLLPGTPEVPPQYIPQAWELEKTVDTSRPSRVIISTPPPQHENSPLVFTPSTGVITLEPGAALRDHQIVNADIELVGFSPSTATVKRATQPTPEPLTSYTRPEPSVYDEDMEREIRLWERGAGLNTGSDIEEDVVDHSEIRRRHAGEFDVDELPNELREVLLTIDRQDDSALRDLAHQDMLTFEWSHNIETFTGEREIFTGPAGPTFSTNNMSPFQVFAKIWDEEIIQLIVLETNRYAASLCRDLQQSENSRIKRWIPITSEELWTFFGLLMTQSIVPIPVEKEYWTPCLPYLKIGNFAEIMPLYRFQLIKRCLHFVDNDLCARGVPSKLSKIKGILDYLNKKFCSLYLPEQEIAIDESLLLWKGRLSFAQLINSKAAQVGIKTYELCESRTGYLWQMSVYTGKKDGHNSEAANFQAEGEPEGATSKIVFNLVRPLLNRGHTVVMDNFYNSPLLARTLKAQKTDVMGTLRLNREFVPDSLRHKNKGNMRTGEVAYSQTKDITITVWKDANVVSMISTYHKIEVGGKEKYGHYKYKPKVVLDYNLSMGGVDKKDQLLQAFPIERVKNLIWYKKLFRRLLNVSIHNAFVMSQSGEAHITQRQFRVRLADEILQRFRPPKIQPPPSTGHFPAKTDKRKSRCKWCTMKKRKDTCTSWKCDTCNVNLCIINCFREYHTA